MPMNIAIDGPVGAGKSSIADQVAQRLHILHLDTGAMYRTVALYMMRNGIDPQDAGIARRLFSLHENNSPRRCPDTSRSRPHEAERRRRSEESIRHISVLT